MNEYEFFEKILELARKIPDESEKIIGMKWEDFLEEVERSVEDSKKQIEKMDKADLIRWSWIFESIYNNFYQNLAKHLKTESNNTLLLIVKLRKEYPDVWSDIFEERAWLAYLIFISLRGNFWKNLKLTIGAALCWEKLQNLIKKNIKGVAIWSMAFGDYTIKLKNPIVLTETYFKNGEEQIKDKQTVSKISAKYAGLYYLTKIANPKIKKIRFKLPKLYDKDFYSEVPLYEKMEELKKMDPLKAASKVLEGSFEEIEKEVKSYLYRIQYQDKKTIHIDFFEKERKKDRGIPQEETDLEIKRKIEDVYLRLNKNRKKINEKLGPIATKLIADIFERPYDFKIDRAKRLGVSDRTIRKYLSKLLKNLNFLAEILCLNKDIMAKFKKILVS